MEMYNLHNTAAAPQRSVYKRYFRRAINLKTMLKVIMGVFVVLCLLALMPLFSSTKKTNLGLAPQIRQIIKQPITRVISNSVRRPATNVKAWRGYGPFGPSFTPGFGRVVDMMNIFDELSAFNDLEDLMTSRRIREAYEEELENIRKRREMRGVRQKNDGREANKSMGSVQPSQEKEIAIDKIAGLQKMAQWNIPYLEQQHTEDSYRYVLDIQGMDRDNIKLTLQNNIMIVEGKKMVETENGYHSSSFKRSFTIPPNADFESLSSHELEGGRLMIRCGKINPDPSASGREIHIERLPVQQKDSIMSNDGADQQKGDDGIVEDIPPSSDVPPST